MTEYIRNTLVFLLHGYYGSKLPASASPSLLPFFTVINMVPNSPLLHPLPASLRYMEMVPNIPLLHPLHPSLPPSLPPLHGNCGLKFPTPAPPPSPSPFFTWILLSQTSRSCTLFLPSSLLLHPSLLSLHGYYDPKLPAPAPLSLPSSFT